MDAGGDWDGDGHPDVVMGGGNKVDIEQQPNRPDESANQISLYLRQAFTTEGQQLCPDEPAGTPPSTRDIQYPSIVLRGTQFSTLGLNDSQSNNWMLSDRFGWAVRFVGDIDGPAEPPPGETAEVFDDILCSAPWYDVDTGAGIDYQAGAVFLYLGRDFDQFASTATDYEVRPSDQATDDGGFCDLVITGEAAGDYFGYSIARSTDFDGDGIPDLVIGAPQYAWQDSVLDASVASSVNEYWANDDLRPGKVYVVLGGPLRILLNSPPPVPPLPTLRTLKIADLVAAGDALEIVGATATARDRFGASLDGIGDHITGSGMTGDELVIGAPQFRSDWSPEPFGAPGRKTPDEPLDDTDGGSGFAEVWTYSATSGATMAHVIAGPAEAPGANAGDGKRSRFGWSVSRISTSIGAAPTGFAIGAPGFNILPDPQGTEIWANVGHLSAYKWLPGTGGPTLDFTLTGSQAGAEFGYSLASGGDFNGDAIADLAIGSRLFTRTGTNSPCSCSGSRPFKSGRLVVVSTAPLCGIDNCRLLGELRGEESRDRLGFSCAFMGDVDGIAGDEVVGGALAWPEDSYPTPLLGSDCAPCFQCLNITVELGRGYLFSWGM